MFHFLRKLRKSNSSKYVKYAFGEIVLVVIGIFIAIQLNAYYEHKKLTKEHQIHLQKLVGELDDNIARLNSLANEGDSVNVSLERANQGLSEARKLFFKTFEMSQLGYVCDLPRSYGGSLYNLKDITYQELLNTGKLFALGEDELIDGIVDYYKRIERENLHLNLNNA